jgi:integrase
MPSLRSAVDMRRWLVHLPGTKRETRDRVVPIVDFARPWLRLAMRSWPFEPWSNVRRDLHTACVAAKIEKCSPNDLRRSVASLMRAKGVEPALIGQFLGHNDSRMAERVYGQISPTELQGLLAARMRRTAGVQRRA